MHEAATTSKANVGKTERVASGAGGGALLLYGLSRRNLRGMLMAAAGGGVLYRAVTGVCPVYKALRVNTAGSTAGPSASVAHGEGIKVERSVTVNRSVEELYRYWRNFENLPRVMDHLESVTVQDRNRSHWVAKGPAGRTVVWDAEIINERENELIGWRSLEGADIRNAGSVHFTPAPGGRGTEVRVVLEYAPPAGRLGAAVAGLFRESPEVQIREDLRRFKQLMEAREFATTAGQPTAAR